MIHAPTAVRAQAVASRPGVFSTMLVAFLLVAGTVVVAVRVGFAGARFIPALNLPKTPLGDTPPVFLPAPRRLADRVVLVLIDGLRLDASYGRPFLDGLRARGVDAEAQTHHPSISLPNYVSLLTGVEPRWSGVRSNHYRWRLQLDTLVTRARGAGMRVTYVGDGEPIFLSVFAPEFDDAVYAFLPGMTERGVAAALARGDELLFLVFSAVDQAGHRHGAASPQYRDAARRVDAMLAATLGEVDLSNTAIIVVADHGHVDAGGHGGDEPEVMTVPLVMAGAGIAPGAVVTDARLVDVAPTVAALLGIPAPGHALGHTLTSALAVDRADAEMLATADAMRASQLLPILEATEAQARERLAVMHRERGVTVATALLCLGALIVLLARRGIVIVDRRVLLIAVPVFPALFYGMLIVFDNWLSPSMVPGRDQLALKLSAYGIVGAGAHLAAAWTALRGRAVPRERLAAASAITLVGMLIAVGPALVAWASTGHPLAVILPGPDALVFAPTTYMGVACYAAGAAIVLLVEYVVFLARASDPLRATL